MNNKSKTITFFSSNSFEVPFLQKTFEPSLFDCRYLETNLNHQTAELVRDSEIVSLFVEDKADKYVLDIFKERGVRHIALRSAGFNNIDLEYAKKIGISVARVPAYSPHAIAEHTFALILSLNRKIHKSYHRVRDFNFSLNGLTGFDLYKKTIGIIGTGKIGMEVVKIARGFGMKVLAYDKFPNEEVANLTNVQYCDLEELYQNSDIISLHAPLTEETHHLLGEDSFKLMKDGLMLINTSRGGLIDTNSMVQNIKNKKIGSLGLDVYEEEEGVFFKDLSSGILYDDRLARLTTFPNVLITSHQAFLTQEALSEISQTTLKNIESFVNNETNENLL
ncbi:MAG: 2-hydroxyacid dehydrogenase [Bacteriovoracaceae bacterium]